MTYVISSVGKLWWMLAAFPFLLPCVPNPTAGAIVPDNRTAPWQGNVGVPGGIPNRTRIYKNIVTDLGADPTGKQDCSSIVQNALASCPSGQVVYIPEGTFLFTNRVYLPQKSNVTLRGAGQGITTIKTNNNINMVFLFGTQTNLSDPVAIVSGATKGSNTITVAHASSVGIDSPLFIGPNSLPTWAHNLGGFPDTLRSMTVGFKVRSPTQKSTVLRSGAQWHKRKEQADPEKEPATGRSSNSQGGPSATITFDPPLPFDFSGMNPVASWVQAYPDGFPFIQGVGVESLTFDLSGGQQFAAVQFQQAWGCWLKDVEIKGAYSRQAFFDRAMRCEGRGCYAHDAQRSGPSTEGIILNNASWNLVEDNICNNGGAPPIIVSDGGTGGSCNVIGYNYVTNTAPGFWDISFCHGRGSLLNLAEGNVIKDFEDDGYFGSSSYGTLFRNRIDGQVRLKHFSNFYNVVGNVLGESLGTRNSCDGFTVVYESNQSDYWHSHVCPVYELGFPNIGNASYTGTFGPTNPPDYSTLPSTLDGCQQLDRNVAATILRHGNWDKSHNAVVWDANIPDHTIPSSLYYSSQPGWWPGGIPFPPIGPDRTPMVSKIPAQLRFLAKSDRAPSATPPQQPGAASATAEPTPPRASSKGWKRARPSSVGRRL